MPKGFFDLQSPDDDLKKLKRELIKLQVDPYDVDTALSFITTSAHLAERIGGKDYKKKLIDPGYNNPLPRICDELVNLAKHHEPNSPMVYVEDTCHQSWIDRDLGEAGLFDNGDLEVKLTQKGMDKLGFNNPKVRIDKLAELVVNFWESIVRNQAKDK